MYRGIHLASAVLLCAFALTYPLEAKARGDASALPPEHLQRLERSYWVHASLGASLVKGYWAKEAPVGAPPTAGQVRNAAGLLCTRYGANRLYLVYHKEVPPADFGRLLRLWRAASPRSVDLIPTLVLRMYDNEQHELFTEDEAREVCTFIKRELRCRQVAVYDVMPNRDQGKALGVLAREFSGGIIRVGLQPDEDLRAPYVAAVQDTWSGLCHGKTNDDWLAPGFGAETLRKWVTARNGQEKPIAWDLVAVAWDYSTTQRGEYPGYDDALKNMPLPPGRNRLAAREIMKTANNSVFRGFSSDLVGFEGNCRSENRDGPGKSIYECLKRGQVYRGYFSGPLEEIASVYWGLRDVTPNPVNEPFRTKSVLP